MATRASRSAIAAIARARDRVGNGGRASRARLACERWLQRQLPGVQRWDGGRPMAASRARDRDERPGSGIHGYVRPGQQQPVSTAATTRLWTAPPYADDFNAVKALGRKTGSTRTEDQTALAPFWEGNASVHWNQAANQIARANHLSISRRNRLLAVLNIAMADTAFTIWSAKRFYGAMPTEVTWRPVTAITLAATDGNPDTAPDVDWLPLVTTPSHPEYPAGHPSLNGAAATVLLSHFSDRQTFTLTTTGQPTARTPASRRRARTETTPACGAACTIRARSRSAMPWAERSRATWIGTPCSGSVDERSARRRRTGALGESRPCVAHLACLS